MVFLTRRWNVALLIGLLCLVASRVLMPDVNVQPDSRRYISMGLNLAEYGTLSPAKFVSGVQPEPGLGMGGVYTALEIALAAKLHKPTRETLICLVATDETENCEIRIPALQGLYIAEIFIFHLSILTVSYLLFTCQIKAWLAVVISLCFKETQFYATAILAEPAYMMTSGLFLVAWLYAWKRPHQFKFWFWCGLALGLTALVKPGWNAVLPALGMMLCVLAIWRRDLILSMPRPALSFLVGVCIIMAPLLVRNIVQLDHWGMSDPSYFALSLSVRAGFNLMSWTEWAIGWIFYLPLSGAGRLFGYEVLEPLGWGDASYYVYGLNELSHLSMGQGGPREAVQYLWSGYFFNDPIKAIAVTVLLFWRGIFVGHVLGMLAVPSCVSFFFRVDHNTRRLFFLLSLPPLIMVGVHALITANIYRYNIPLIVPYAVSMAYFAYFAIQWGMRKLPLTVLRKVSWLGK